MDGPATPGEARRQWRGHLPAALAPNLRLGLAGTFTLEPFLPLAGACLLARGFVPALALGPFNQLFQVCLDPRAHLGECDVIVLAWRLEDLMGEELNLALRGAPAAAAACLEKIALLTQAIAGLRARFAGSIIVAVPPLPSTLPVGLLELGSASGLGALHRTLVSALLAQLAPPAGVALWDLDALQNDFGLGAACDFRQWYLYRQPFSDRFLFAAAQLLARVVTAQRRTSRKCVVLDGDNTLWGGVLGEDGLAGVQIGDEFPGAAYRDLQRLLLHWRSQGVLLALASKNNEADVWEMFAKHSGLELGRADFAAARINWRSKPANLLEIAQELHLGLETFVFIDDSPYEIEAMRQALPEVLCVQLPDDPAEILPALRSLTCFDRLAVTDEDRTRTEMMQAEKQRRKLGQDLGQDEFLRSIALQVRLFRAEETDFDRITQLINKTNQFNLTTRRRTLDEVRELAARPAHRIYGVQVTDRFGAYGLTGVVILEQRPAERCWIFDTFLLSCRVLGRGVESAVLEALAAEALSEGMEELRARFIPSAKNAPAAHFLPEHGFRLLGDRTWVVAPSRVRAASPAISLPS